MPYDPQRHHRRSIRLPGYDYTQVGGYFITIVVHERACLFGEVVNGVMRLNAWGEIARAEWFQTAVVRQFKSITAKRINALRNTPGAPVWQRNDYEHIIRNDEEWQRIRQYIQDNPARWEADRENPAALR